MDPSNRKKQRSTRRGFLAGSLGIAAGAMAAGAGGGTARSADFAGKSLRSLEPFTPSFEKGPITDQTYGEGSIEMAATPVVRRMNRVGAVAYSFQYSIGLFTYKDRPGLRFDALKFVEETRRAGGSVAQLFVNMIQTMGEDELKRLRAKAADLDVMLEVHGGTAFAPAFEKTLRQAAVLGAKVVGCSFGMLTRPNVIGTLEGWDEHLAKCKARLRELADMAKPLGIAVAVENHLDLTVEELRDLIKEIDSPHARVLFDVGNTVGTLDDPTEAADILGPYTAATHYKDFAIEEVTRGFRFTMVPLGAGSLRLREITERLLKHVSPEMGMSIEMMNGQEFEVTWLEDRFWPPFRDKTARQVAATLRHIRGKAIDISEFKPQDELDKQLKPEDHVKLEFNRIRNCISTLRGILADAGQTAKL